MRGSLSYEAVLTACFDESGFKIESERERERERASLKIKLSRSLSLSLSLSLCICVCERERERESVSVCVCVSVRPCVCVCGCACVCVSVSVSVPGCLGVWVSGCMHVCVFACRTSSTLHRCRGRVPEGVAEGKGGRSFRGDGPSGHNGISRLVILVKSFLSEGALVLCIKPTSSRPVLQIPILNYEINYG